MANGHGTSGQTDKQKAVAGEILTSEILPATEEGD
uniref:Uncharacterized protein n=1 Tax=Pseudomonas putida TaxID=303 RepID=A0A2Z1CE49_PSEPU|nr:Hypothetical protein [Pseudomonas putida]